METLCTDLCLYLATYLDQVDKSVIYFTSKWLRQKMEIDNAPRREFLRLAARKGYFSLLKWCKENNFQFDKFVYKKAIQSGQLPILQWLTSLYCPRPNTCLDMAAKRGLLKMVKWLHKEGYEWSAFTSGHAAKSGNLALIKWLHKHKCEIGRRSVIQAAKIGHLHILEWCEENLELDYKQAIALNATACIDSLQFCFQNAWVPPPNACEKAAFFGNLESLRLLLDYGYSLGSKVVTESLKGDSVHIIAYLVQEKGIVLPKNILFQAIDFCAKKTLLWLREIGYEWTSKLLVFVSKRTHLQREVAVRWLITNGCPCER